VVSFIAGERAPRIHWIGGWVKSRDALDDAEKILEATRTRTPDPLVVQPEASRYTDYASFTISTLILSPQNSNMEFLRKLACPSP
jgi:hypothetical protein